MEEIKELLFPPENSNTTVVQESTFVPKNAIYNTIDSFALDNGLNYYIFELGSVNYVPMNIEGADGVLFNGTETEMTFHYSETKKEESSRLIENTIETSIELSTTTYSKASVEAPIAGVFKGGLEFGVESSVSTGITDTFVDSFYNSVSNESTFEKTLNYGMNKNDPKGYYFYTPGGFIGAIIGGYKYKIHFTSNGNNFYTFTDYIETEKTISRSMVSDLISLDRINGEISFYLSTENVRDLVMENINITLEFVK